ncbi:MAG: neutral/alkaline non-lysosomal ceramidase N-terminal domain-containing protein [Planctomycetaceae bacterium]|nr:neutral/alkaline non-lysosomal ceramidase N-terminal domain-containing protein [Planctomycetaceae bacterium]
MLLAISPVVGMSQDADGKVLRAGAAKSNITPPLGERVIGGFAPFPSTNIHDELHARCLILDNGVTKLGFVICDNLGIQKDIYNDVRKLIAEETDFPAENLLMAATHTHSATPSSSETYRPLLVRRIADCIRRALQNMEEAKIGWGGVDEPSEVFNRRWYVTDPELRRNPFGGIDEVRMNPPRGGKQLIKPAGPIDPEVSFISVQTKDGRPLALLGNYSLHYVGNVERGEISSDYFGIFSERIGELIGADDDFSHPPFVGMMSNGTSGDINNINFPNPTKKRYAKYEKMTEVAEKVAQKVKSAYEQIEHHDWVPLGVANRELTLKVRKPDSAMQAYFKEVRAKPEGAEKFHRYETNYADRVQRLLDGPEEYVIPLQAMRIGDLAIAAIPFETFVEIGLEIKERSPFGDAFTIELANDYHGYLPTPEQHKLGGYETWMGTNRVEFEASEKITDNILEMMQELKGE